MLDRLLQLIKEEGYTIASFERAIGVSNATISKAIERKKGVSSDVLIKILETFQSINPDWLLLGKEPKLRRNAQDSADEIEKLQKKLKESYEEIGELKYKLRIEREKVSSSLGRTSEEPILQ